MTDDRLAWEDHSLDCEQLDLFAPEPEATRGAYEDELPVARVYQLTELPGETFEDIFRGAA